MQDIDDLLECYNARTRDEQRIANEQHKTVAKARDKARTILEAIALPPLKEVCNSLTAKGHRSEVREQFEFSTPGVDLVFAPIRNEQFPGIQSVLCFMVADDGIAHITSKVMTRSNKSYKTNCEVALDDLSASKVRQRAIEFIESVLSAN